MDCFRGKLRWNDVITEGDNELFFSFFLFKFFYKLTIIPLNVKTILKHCENMPDFHNEKGETIDPFKKGKMVEPEGGEQSSEHIVGAGDATIGHTDRPAEGSFAYNTMITVDEAD